MMLVGVEFLLNQIAQTGFAAKLVVNHKGAIFFPINEQHRDQKAPGISYADESAGNALAAMLSPGKIEIRTHRDFSAERVAQIMTALFSLTELAPLRMWIVMYGGQNVNAVPSQL